MDEEPDKRNINGSYQWSRSSDERIRRLENKVNGVDKAEGLLEVGQATRQEQIATLREQCVEINHDVAENSKQIGLLRNRIDDALTATSQKFEDALLVTNKKFDEALLATNIKFDENKNYFTRYFIIILVTILTGLVVGGAEFILNR
jgi:uncharacterized coiled-coil protein SlyX